MRTPAGDTHTRRDTGTRMGLAGLWRVDLPVAAASRRLPRLDGRPVLSVGLRASQSSRAGVRSRSGRSAPEPLHYTRNIPMAPAHRSPVPGMRRGEALRPIPRLAGFPIAIVLLERI